MTGERPEGRWRPAVKPPFVPVVLDPDTIQFRIGPWAGPQFTIRDHDGEGRIGDLIQLLDGQRSVEEVLGVFEPDERGEVSTVIDRLYDEGVLIDADGGSDDFLGGYVSSNPAFRSDTKVPLEESTVLIVNDGLVGRTVVEDLVAIGVEGVSLYEPSGADDPAVPGGTVSLCDPDVALADEIRRADCVVYAEDAPNPQLIDEVNRLAFETKTPWVSGRIHGLDGAVGPAVLPGRTSCYECFRTRAATTVGGESSYRQLEAALGEASASLPLPSFARVIAGYLTVDLLHLLLEGTGFTVGRAIHFDFFDLTVESNTVLKLPRCGVCGRSNRDRLDWQRYLSLEQLIGSDTG